LDGLPGHDALYQGFLQNEGSLVRLRTLLTEAPSLLEAYASPNLTKILLTGGADPSADSEERLHELPTTCSLNQLAESFAVGWYGACLTWLIAPDFDLGHKLSALVDVLLVHCARRLYVDFDVIALGSYGRRELAPLSGIELLLLVPSEALHQQAESQAADMLALLEMLKRLGAPISVDFQLRPDGARGPFARTYEGFLAYELEGMEMLERFAIGMSRGVLGSEEAPALVQRVAYAIPLTPERLRELLEGKRRKETERLKPQYRRRDVKFGEGSLTDLEWFVHLMELRYPTASRAGEHHEMEERIRALARAGLINAIEKEELIQARRYLLDLRNRLVLMGNSHGILPENPDKLEQLAPSVGAKDANDLLLRHHRITRTVRNIFIEGMEGLKAW